MAMPSPHDNARKSQELDLLKSILDESPPSPPNMDQSRSASGSTSPGSSSPILKKDHNKKKKGEQHKRIRKFSSGTEDSDSDSYTSSYNSSYRGSVDMDGQNTSDNRGPISNIKPNCNKPVADNANSNKHIVENDTNADNRIVAKNARPKSSKSRTSKHKMTPPVIKRRNQHASVNVEMTVMMDKSVQDEPDHKGPEDNIHKELGSEHGRNRGRSGSARGQRRHVHNYTGLPSHNVNRHTHNIEKKYEELKDILEVQYKQDQTELNRQLLHQTRQLLQKYRMLGQNNAALTVHPPPGAAPPRNRRRCRIKSPKSARSDSSTQTSDELPSSQNSSNRQDADYVYIDMNRRNNNQGSEVSYGTLGQPIKHVTFAGPEGESVGSRDNDSDIVKMEQEIESLIRGRQKRRKGKAGTASVKSNATDNHRNRSSSGNSSSSSVSPQRNGKFSSESSGTDTDSQSPSRKAHLGSDHLLKNTKNPTIKDWLRKKNKILRKQKREERKKEREKRKKEEAEIKVKEKSRAESEVKVDAWMRTKKDEDRLLRRQRRESRGAKAVKKEEKEEELLVDELVDLKSGRRVSEASIKSENGKSRVREGGEGKEKTESEKDGNNYCGFEKTPSDGANKKGRAQRPYSARAASAKTQMSVPKKSVTMPVQSVTGNSGLRGGKVRSPTNSGGAESNSDEQKASYDNWLKKKRQHTLKMKKEERKKKQELAESSDPELVNVIKDMAKKRIEKINSRKKRVDTGVKRIDKEANKSIEERLAERKIRLSGEVVVGTVVVTGTSDNEGEAKEEDAEVKEEGDADEEKTPEVSAKGYRTAVKNAQAQSSDTESKRPQSARSGSSTSRRKGKVRGRPMSGRNNTMHVPQPGRSAKSPSPAPSRLPDNGDENPREKPFVYPWREGSPSPTRPRAKSPKPKEVVKKNEPYKKVKYQQKSWDNFSEYVWDKVNEDEGGEMVEPGEEGEKGDPESAGHKEEEEKDPEGKDEVRPEPQGADTPDSTTDPRDADARTAFITSMDPEVIAINEKKIDSNQEKNDADGTQDGAEGEQCGDDNKKDEAQTKNDDSDDAEEDTKDSDSENEPESIVEKEGLVESDENDSHHDNESERVAEDIQEIVTQNEAEKDDGNVDDVTDDIVEDSGDECDKDEAEDVADGDAVSAADVEQAIIAEPVDAPLSVAESVNTQKALEDEEEPGYYGNVHDDTEDKESSHSSDNNDDNSDKDTKSYHIGDDVGEPLI